MVKLIIPATLLLMPMPALAQIVLQDQPQQTNKSDQPNADAKARNRVICQDITDIGSRLSSHRLCMTAEQWRQRQQEDQDAVADSQRQAQGSSPQ
jgi:hypothetical protein